VIGGGVDSIGIGRLRCLRCGLALICSPNGVSRGDCNSFNNSLVRGSSSSCLTISFRYPFGGPL
jgi:hypothetical protein